MSRWYWLYVTGVTLALWLTCNLTYHRIDGGHDKNFLTALTWGSIFGTAWVVVERVIIGIIFKIKKRRQRRVYKLMEMHGPISDRLRKQFDKNDEAWFPPRDETEPKKTPLPKGRDGWSVTGRSKKK